MRKWYLAISPSPLRRSRSGSVGQGVGVAHTAAGCQKAPTRFLPSGRLTPGLAADGGVDHAEQRGGHVHHAHAPVVDGGGEPGGVGDHPAAHGHHLVAPGQAPLRPGPAQLLHRGQRLGLLAVADREHPVLAPGSTAKPMPGLGHDRHPPGARGQQAGQLGGGAGADHHRVAAAAGVDLDRDHDRHRRCPACSATRAAMWRASARLGLSSPAWNGSTSTATSATAS